MIPAPRHPRHFQRMHGANARNAKGFSMIEVLIALLILAGGLLGFALLQTMSIRFAQSANYRTQATNLAYELIDQIRANRTSTGQFVQGIGDFTGVNGENCTPVVGPVTPDDSMDGWHCRVMAALGADVSATLTQPVLGQVRVEITWDDERWGSDPDKMFWVETEL